MNLTKLILFFALTFYLSFALDNVKFAIIIRNFVKLERKPTKIVAFLCWKMESITNLIKIFNKQNILISSFFGDNYKNDHLPSYPPQQNHLFYILDMNCKESSNILLKASKDKLLYFPHRWMLLQNEVKNILKQFFIPLNSRVYILNITNLEIKSIYQIYDKSDLMVQDVGAVDGDHFVYLNQIFDAKNRSDLMGMKMNLSAVTNRKENEKRLEDFRDLGVDSYPHFCWMPHLALTEFLNITPHHIFHREWGIRLPNSTAYSGLIGDLQTGRSELSATGLYMRSERLAVMDYPGFDVAADGYFFFIKPPLSVMDNIFSYSFSRWVWYASYLIIIIIFFVIFIIIRWEHYTEKFKNNPTLIVHLQPRALDVLNFEIGAICQQGSEAEPRSISGKIASFTIFLAFLFLYTSYSANIVVLLQSSSELIQDLPDLLTTNIKLGMDDTPVMRKLTMLQTEKVKSAIYNMKLAPPNKPDNFMPVDEGMTKMRNEFFAYFTEDNSAYKYISKHFLDNEKCGIKSIVYWQVWHPIMVVRKNSSYSELIKIGHKLLIERGITKRSYKRIYLPKPTCTSLGSKFVNVSLNDCYFPMIAFCCGTGVALIIFIGEILLNKYSKI